MKTTPEVLIQDIITSNAGAWLINATLRIFCLAEQCHTHKILIWQKNLNNPKNEGKCKYYSDLKNDDKLQNQSNQKRKMTSKMKMTSNMKTNEDELKNEDVLKNCPPTQQQF